MVFYRWFREKPGKMPITNEVVIVHVMMFFVVGVFIFNIPRLVKKPIYFYNIRPIRTGVLWGDKSLSSLGICSDDTKFAVVPNQINLPGFPQQPLPNTAKGSVEYIFNLPNHITLSLPSYPCRYAIFTHLKKPLYFSFIFQSNS